MFYECVNKFAIYCHGRYVPDCSSHLGLVGRVGGVQEGEGGEVGGREATLNKNNEKQNNNQI